MGENQINKNECNELNMKTIAMLKGYTFSIPYQQRGYKWTSDNIKMLLDDLSNFLTSGNKTYCLQPIAVVEEDKVKSHYSVVDGQQRLTTLYLIHKYLTSDDKELTPDAELFHYEYERDNNNERKTLLRNKIDTVNDKTIDSYYITNAYKTIREWFEKENKEDLKNRIRALLEAKDSQAPKSIQLIWYTIEKEKAHEAFRNINSGKIQLTNTDLIKALLLNRENKLPNKDQIAAQFELMERQFEENRFWYILKKEDIDRQKGQTRMDFLFNMVCEIKDSKYEIEHRSSFFELSKLKDDELLLKWKKIREVFQRIKDLFDDPYTFHYVGFLIYCSENKNKNNLIEILKKNEELNKKEFIGDLRRLIKKKYLGKYHLEDCGYGERALLLKIFVLHNIETILQRYEQLKQERSLRFSYEYFPFELLNNGKWHIEHIASYTDNDLKSKIDKKDWLESIKADYPKIFTDKVLKLEKDATDFSDEKKWKILYNEIIETTEMKEIFQDSIKDEAKKNGIGNLVLLDAHTNTSFHNSLFPRKRKIVILASGLRHNEKSKDEVQDVQSVYVPICTQQVYTKAYNKSSNVKLNAWTKDDFDAYLKDIKEKLAFYFKEK